MSLSLHDRADEDDLADGVLRKPVGGNRYGLSFGDGRKRRRSPILTAAGGPARWYRLDETATLKPSRIKRHAEAVMPEDLYQ
jgi:hypothetical protein